ncbi:ChbG/HpnK family deacetylase [Pseudonocardia sp. TMWB2A]|uniref:ChbG/HpnK family deacetylase n=1 Tax=Pseudonocardia sp. TMWB2A TaxID=687430 RepID=UPI00307E44B7
MEAERRRRPGPVLVDDKGRLFLQSRRAELLRTARIDEVEIEFRAQIAAVRRTGISPTHLDFHSLADGGRADVFNVAAGLAAEHGCALRVWLEPNRTCARAAGLPVVDHPFLDSFTLAPTARAEHYERLLRDLPAGLTEWAVHPASDDDVAEGDEHDRRVRGGDHSWLTSSRARTVIAEERIDLVGYDAVQAVWQDRHRALPRS